ncbi:MAG: hypothetical protein ACW967_07980 [Candidatus Hodarchaeales archaeon]|jgi:hypothetical protein
MTKTSVKIDRAFKEKLELLQAKLRLEKGIRLDQYELLGKIISFAYDHYVELDSYFNNNNGVMLTSEQIRNIEKEIIISEEIQDKYKTDDELIYGI